MHEKGGRAQSRRAPRASQAHDVGAAVRLVKRHIVRYRAGRRTDSFLSALAGAMLTVCRERGVLAVTRLILLLCAFGAVSSARAQSVSDRARGLDAAGASPRADTDVSLGDVAVEDPIDPETYVLGPLDGIVLAIWSGTGGQTATHELSVTYEERLLIPSVGEVNVAGLTMAEAEREVAARVRDRLGDVRVTLTLTRLRRMKIPVTGHVAAPGIHVVRSQNRVSELLSRVGLAEGASNRHITVSGRGGSTRRVDLVRFRRLGDASMDPVLGNGDAVHVPFAVAYVHVYGAVNAPGRFEHVEGDRLSDLLAFAGGFAQDARRDTLVLARIHDGSGPPERVALTPALDATRSTVYVPVGTAKSEPADYLVEPNDRLFVKRIGDYGNRQVVTLVGEVANPGDYPIVEGETRLREVIRRAGGLTSDASLEEASLVRTASQTLTDPEFERLRNVPVADMTDDEYEYFKMRARETPGRMVVDFRKLLVEGSAAHDVLLIDGDVISIPLRKDFVSVLGLVRDPGNVTFESSHGYRDYVALAGGFAERADRGKTRVVRAGSGEWQEPGDVRTFRPGDTIWVPEKRDRDYWKLFRDGLLVATQIATLYLVADRAAN